MRKLVPFLDAAAGQSNVDVKGSVQCLLIGMEGSPLEVHAVSNEGIIYMVAEVDNMMEDYLKKELLHRATTRMEKKSS